MKKIAQAIIMSFILIFATPVVLAQTEQYDSYDRVQKAVNELEQAKKYEEAIALMKSVEGKFLGYEYEIIREFAYLYLKTEQYEKCLDAWQEGHKKGFFFLIHPNLPQYKPLKDLVRFNDLAAEDDRLRREALTRSETVFESELPTGYDESKKYPLLIILHGGGSNIAQARKHWHSPVMKKEYIVVFIQSYLHYGMKDFGWRKEDPRAREDIKNIYRELIHQYSVDTSKVIIGGISAGGSAAMDISLNQIIPTRGIIGVCPAIPGDRFTTEQIKKASRVRIRAYLITGENDPGREGQEKTVELFESEKLQNKFIVISGMGHEYPDDFSRQINSALTFLNFTG